MSRKGESNKKSYVSVFDRIEAFRISQDLTWKQVAERLGVSVSMLMLVKSGKRNLSRKAQFRLSQAEAGVSKPSVTSATERDRFESHVRTELAPYLEKLSATDRAEFEDVLSRVVGELLKMRH